MSFPETVDEILDVSEDEGIIIIITEIKQQERCNCLMM